MTTSLPILDLREPVPARGTRPGRNASILSLVDELLAQQQAPAVEQFASLASSRSRSSATLRAKVYQSLLPATPPGPGEQYGFEVNLDLCSGCKACVAACHEMNGLDDDETWREVGMLHGEIDGGAVLQHVTSSCHHCVDPGCLNGCPTLAYEKDPTTGIVRHLDDQCFGCQYCTMACPYDAPKYREDLGIVRKCDMCSGRLSAGEAPACVQACPHSAIRIRTVSVADAAAFSAAGCFLPDSPDPRDTVPTTRYVSSRELPDDLKSADQVEFEHAHWPLAWMLTLTQAATGLYLGGAAARLFPSISPSMIQGMLTAAWAAAVIGVHASLFHLGRPHLAFRGVLGWRRSWLSREIIAFGLFLAAATLASVPPLSGMEAATRFAGPAAAGAAAAGLLGVFCSIQIYRVVPRPFWDGANVGARFGGTVLVMGIAGLWMATAGSATRTVESGHCRLLLAAAITLKIAAEAFLVLGRRRKDAVWRSAAARMTGDKRMTTVARWAFGLVGGVLLPALAARASHELAFPLAAAAAILLAAGELCERHLFFVACPRLKMPGAIQ